MSSWKEDCEQLRLQVHRDFQRAGPQRGRAAGGDPGPGEAQPQAGARVA